MLGVSIPLKEPHALSVSLPTWRDTVGWAEGDSAIVDQMATGYPRFFIHRTIQKLERVVLEKFGSSDELCMLFPTIEAANECISYLSRYAHSGDPHSSLKVISLNMVDSMPTNERVELHVVFFTQHSWKTAKSFWQHAGMGVSSRYATTCLSRTPQLSPHQKQSGDVDNFGASIKLQLRKRIATLASYGDTSTLDGSPIVGDATTVQFPLEDDVFLYPTGMSAIWHAHRMTVTCRPGLKPVCFGFLYTDTIKILEKWDPGCHFFGHDPDTNLAAFEAFLASSLPHATSNGVQQAPLQSPISAIFCECPSNPLLQSSDIVRLRQLADQYGFAIIIDDTIGTFVNTDLLRYADVIVTSLSKLVSGQADVMGGSLILNPKSTHYEAFRDHMKATFLDSYYTPDAVRMENNSRDFASRVRVINANTRALCAFLRSRSLSHDSASPESTSFVIKEVFYPEYTTPANYNMYRRPGQSDNFGSLFSLTFTSMLASETFYDALPCAKGPSLGTNFTLSCPYTILAHYHELDWAARYGVEEGLVRISVGMEDIETLLGWFKRSLDVAEAAVRPD